jgi:hypothetical protein
VQFFPKRVAPSHLSKKFARAVLRRCINRITYSDQLTVKAINPYPSADHHTAAAASVRIGRIKAVYTEQYQSSQRGRAAACPCHPAKFAANMATYSPGNRALARRGNPVSCSGASLPYPALRSRTHRLEGRRIQRGRRLLRASHSWPCSAVTDGTKRTYKVNVSLACKSA